MAKTFIMSEKDLAAGLAKFTASVKEMQDGAQTLLYPCVEYAIRNCNATYCNQLLAALPEKMQPYMREFMTRKGVPLVWDKDKKKIAFSFRLAKQIYKEKGKGTWDTKSNPDQLTDSDKGALDFISALAITVLESGKWYDSLKADQKAEREAAKASKSTADKEKAIRESYERLCKKAKEAGVTLPSGEAVVLPPAIADVVKMLTPVADDNNIMLGVMAAIASCLQVNKQAA